jgi:hypothetical protein
MRRLCLVLEVAIVASASNVSAASGPGPAGKPAANARDAKSLVSVSGMTASDYAACVAELGSSKVVFEPLGAAKDRGCELSGAVKLAAVPTPFGDVSFSGKPTVLCSFAREFTVWARDVAQPLTLAYTGQRLAEIETGSAFDCRARYDLPGVVPSEHAKGNALDISSFVLADGRRVRVKPEESNIPLARGLLRALRTTACGYFTTVLGPGTDAAHAEHLHFDLALHGAAPNYRICE